MDERDCRDIQENCLESNTITGLYSTFQVEKSNATKRKLAAESSEATSQLEKKCKRVDDQTHADEGSSEANERNYDRSDQPTDPISLPIEDEDKATYESSPAPDHSENAHPISSQTSDVKRSPQPSSHQKNSTQNIASEKQMFYLLKPNTQGSSRVLIPLLATKSLTRSLQDKTVLEYPTIYALPHSPDSLPKGFLLEKEYSQRQYSEVRAIGRSDADGNSQTTSSSASSKVIDPARILEMLKRDINR